MTELAPPILSSDNHTFLHAVDSAMQNPELAAKVDAVFGEDTLSLAHNDMQIWVKGAIDASLPTGTTFAERHAAGEQILPVDSQSETFVSTAGDTDFKTGMTPAAVLLKDDEPSTYGDPAGLLAEPDVFKLESRPHEISGVEAHVALIALCAAAKKDVAAEELWERLPLSTTSRKIHEATLADSRVISKTAAFMLKFF